MSATAEMRSQAARQLRFAGLRLARPEILKGFSSPIIDIEEIQRSRAKALDRELLWSATSAFGKGYFEPLRRDTMELHHEKRRVY